MKKEPETIRKYLDDMRQERHAKQDALLVNMKGHMPEMEAFIQKNKEDWRPEEDLIYRYYHTSFKVYYLQDATEEMLSMLKSMSPHDDTSVMSPYYLDIIEKGTGVEFDLSHNKEWDKYTGPIVTAFFHSKYFIEMAIKYGNELDEAVDLLPSGWASLLSLYEIR